MNSKILIAFAGGLILASGITFFAMKPGQPQPVQPVQVAQLPEPVSTPVSTPAATTTPEPAAVEPTPVTPVAVTPAKERRVPETFVQRPSAAVKWKPAAVPAPRGVNSPPQPEKPTAVIHSDPPPARPPDVVKAPEQVASVASPSPAPRSEPPAAAPEPKQPNTVTIPSGTNIVVRIGEALSTERNRPGDSFVATLEQPIVVDGFVLAERGSRAQGRVLDSERAGRVRGVAQLNIEITQITTSDGQKVRVNTSAYKRQAETTTKQDAAKVGIGAALGAAIGAIAGGGKGAGVGAGVGGAAGAGDVLLTRGKAAEILVETRASFRLTEAVTLTEKLN